MPDCGRCDVCAGPWYPTALTGAGREAMDEVVRRPGVVVEARTSWPTGMPGIGVDVKGRIPESERAGDGRAVARFTDLGWGAALRRATATDDEGRPVDAPVADELFGAVTRVLREWDWAERPVAVVAVPSRARPQLVGSLRSRLAQVGRLQDLGDLELRHGGPAGGAGGNSAVRLAGVWDRLAVPSATAEVLADLRGPVLLVDDVVDSRWTLTVAAPGAPPGRGAGGAARWSWGRPAEPRLARGGGPGSQPHGAGSARRPGHHRDEQLDRPGVRAGLDRAVALHDLLQVGGQGGGLLRVQPEHRGGQAADPPPFVVGLHAVRQRLQRGPQPLEHLVGEQLAPPRGPPPTARGCC